MNQHQRERLARIAADVIYGEARHAGERFRDANDYGYAAEQYAAASPYVRPVRAS